MPKKKPQKKMKKEESILEEVIEEERYLPQDALQLINYIFEKAIINSEYEKTKNTVCLK